MSRKANTYQTHQPIVLFDGVCNLCNRFVLFVLSREKQSAFRFASLQSEIGHTLSGKPSGSKDTSFLGSIILIEDNRRYKKSTAVLRILRNLKFFWPAMYVFILVPPPLRNLVYDYVGNRRYQWFGKMQYCWVPTDAIMSRFIDNVSDLSSTELTNIVARLKEQGI